MKCKLVFADLHEDWLVSSREGFFGTVPGFTEVTEKNLPFTPVRIWITPITFRLTWSRLRNCPNCLVISQ